MFLDNPNQHIADPVRVRAQRRSHSYLRKFSDSDLLVAYRHDQTARGLARTLKCNTGTIRNHAMRLGLRLHSSVGIQWRLEEDALIRQCGRGLVTMGTITKLTGHASLTIRERAEELGVTLVVREQGAHTPTQDKRGPKDFEYDHSITVGKVDKLLLKLHEEFGSPRNEIYPGVVVKTA